MGFDFSIAISPSLTNIDRELQYIKSALLYADSITLISPVAYVYSQLSTEALKHDERALIKIMQMCVDLCNEKDPELCQKCKYAVDEFSGIVFSNKYKSNYPLSKKIGIKKTLLESASGLDEAIINFIGQQQSKEFSLLINSGKLKIQNFECSISNVDNMIMEYFKHLRNTLKYNYPLFDELSCDLLSAASDCHIIRLSEIEKKRITQAGLSDNLIQRLPSFERAGVDEILDIRKELDPSLANYRKCILGYSDKIQSLPWNDDFENECSDLYFREVVPAVQEIDELTKENRFIKNLGYAFVEDENLTKSASGLMMGLAAAGVLGNFCDAISENAALLSMGGAWAVSKTAKSAKRYFDKKKEIESKDLYFYYKAGKLL